MKKLALLVILIGVLNIGAIGASAATLTDGPVDQPVPAVSSGVPIKKFTGNYKGKLVYVVQKADDGRLLTLGKDELDYDISDAVQPFVLTPRMFKSLEGLFSWGF